MTLMKKLKKRSGFTLAELMIVIAILAILAGIAVLFVNPNDISYVEYNRSAEAIAVAAQNRLTEIRNSGDMETLRFLGEQASDSGRGTAATVSDSNAGGYRYVFSYSEENGVISKNTGIAYILPFGAIEYDLAQNYYAIGFQSDTGMVGEVFYSEKPFEHHTVEYLLQLQNEDTRKAANVGYYKGEVDDKEIAFANLPTPQLTITNYEELTLSIFLPEVKQLNDSGKKLGILVSLIDEDGKALERKLSLNQTAIYSTFSLGNGSDDEIVVTQDLSSGATYKMILDTVKECNESELQSRLSLDDSTPEQASATPPKGKFENWAKRSGAFKEGDFLLGENSVITVTVYGLYQQGDENYSANFPVDPTYMPRSASVTFNGWFNQFDNDDTVDIACGRHLQNLANLAKLRTKLEKYQPKVTKSISADGEIVYSYGDYNYGMGITYTDGSSSIDSSIKEKDGTDYSVDIKEEVDPNLRYGEITQKYIYRENVQKQIRKANQVNAIDFDCNEWKNGSSRIPFQPISLPSGFTYYGNYLTISHLYVNAPFYAGMFGYAYKARLYDILLVNPTVNSQMPAHLSEVYEMGVGALIGTSRDSDHINNCQVYMSQENGTYNSSYRVTGECYVGGLIGFCEDEHFANCSASVYTGYAKNAQKTVKKATAEGAAAIEETIETEKVAVSSRYVGGLVGCITGDSTLDSCYAAGNLTGEYVGGLIGYIREDSDPSGDDYRIETCYTAGHIEYATKSAAGILGFVSELSGNAKSALSVCGNYCVVIYGEKEGGVYTWNAKDSKGEPIPIYGTFEGDGFEWIRTSDLNDKSDTYFTAKYANKRYFACAVFEHDNKNYYIAQRGITYSNSPYMKSMEEEVKSITQNIENANSGSLESTVKSAQDKIFYQKKLQTLEELKLVMEKFVSEIEAETGKDSEGKPYNQAYAGYLELDRSDLHSNDSSSEHNVHLTILETVHLLYDFDGGKTITLKGKDYTKLTYEGNSHPERKNTTTGIETYTFMGFYDALKEAYNDLLDNDTGNDEAAKKKIELILGTDDGTNYGGAEETKFYKTGLFYSIFYDGMLDDAFSKARDSYNGKDPNAVLIFGDYFKETIGGSFRDLLCDLGISREGRSALLNHAKTDALDDVLKGLKDYPDIIKKWNGAMKSEITNATTLVSNTTTAVTNLKNTIEGNHPVGSTQFETDYTKACEAINALYKFFETNKNLKDVVDLKGNVGEMRTLRNPIENTYLKNVELCRGSANSGVENALDELAVKLKNTGANSSKLVEDFTKEVKQYCDTDSGHKLKNSLEIRNAARGDANFNDTIEEGEQKLGFMYDYGNPYPSKSKDINPYTKDNLVENGSYVNQDNHIYNNVFPYNENGYTKYYPFPFVYGRALETDSKFNPSYVLFHYGDWLTQDLWADQDPVTSALYDTYARMNAIYDELNDVTAEVKNNDTTGKINNQIIELSKAVEDCKAQAQTASASADEAERTRKLQTIESTITEWLGNKGIFSQLEDVCEKAKKEIADLVKPKLVTYRAQLESLVQEIEKLVS